MSSAPSRGTTPPSFRCGIATLLHARRGAQCARCACLQALPAAVARQVYDAVPPVFATHASALLAAVPAAYAARLATAGAESTDG
jgi:hypothetical protein